MKEECWDVGREPVWKACLDSCDVRKETVWTAFWGEDDRDNHMLPSCGGPSFLGPRRPGMLEEVLLRNLVQRMGRMMCGSPNCP
jgi:hypothetical protein